MSESSVACSYHWATAGAWGARVSGMRPGSAAVARCIPSLQDARRTHGRAAALTGRTALVGRSARALPASVVVDTRLDLLWRFISE